MYFLWNLPPGHGSGLRSGHEPKPSQSYPFIGVFPTFDGVRSLSIMSLRCENLSPVFVNAMPLTGRRFILAAREN